ncbi:MAG: hypothetical protein IPM13_05615 [Phycisphaerales bacterium]|nr:hypothetical protein [Phycisphaerales bacterium]
MKTALKISIVAGLILVVAAPALAAPTNGAGYYGGRVNWSRVAGHYTGSGGEFSLSANTPGSLLLSNGAYASVAKGKAGVESFQTFCLEQGEFVGQPMDIWVSTEWATPATGPQWAPGTPLSDRSHSWDGGPPVGIGDDLNPQTAYLYYKFATGTLGGYTYTPGSGRNSSAGHLQNAIWFLEGEIASVSGQAALWVQEAVNATGLNFGTYIASGPVTWGARIGPVRVMQMYWGNEYRQDLLYVLVPAPAAALLGAIGVSLVVWLRRKA